MMQGMPGSGPFAMPPMQNMRSGAMDFNAKPTDSSRMMMWDAAEFMRSGMHSHEMTLAQIVDVCRNLQDILEYTRLQYNFAIEDRDKALQQLLTAEGQIGGVQRVVNRYTTVKDPVVASDGYTYERADICKYIDECKQMKSKAYSQQTKEQLADVVVPNHSLRKLVDLLGTVHPLDVPSPLPRQPVPPLQHQQQQQPQPQQQHTHQGASQQQQFHSRRAHGGQGAGPAQGWADDADGAHAHSAVPRDGNTVGSHSMSSGAHSLAPGAAQGGMNVGSTQRKFNAAVGGSSDGAPQAGGATQGDAFLRKDSQSTTRLHPCLRVFGYCNFKEDCAFSKYPFEACLNHIKGKCRFGSHCKELHVNPTDPRYQNARGGGPGPASSPPAPRSQRDPNAPGDDK